MSPNTLSIDYSYNEPPIGTENIDIINGRSLEAYDFNEIVSEKIRALLQQKERNRHREQDIYDLWYLLTNHPVDSEKEKSDILSRLKIKAASRGLDIDRQSIADPIIEEIAKERYQNLEGTIEGELPSFDTAFSMTKSFYLSLPW